MTDQTNAGSSLARTARWIAAIRARETQREDRLLDDPWAALLAGPEGEAWLAGRAEGPTLAVIAIRARFFDDFLRRAVADASVRQVVLPGAGFDTRAFRIDWPAETRLFELDQKEILDLKQQLLDGAGARPRCERSAVAADLAQDWGEALIRAGFEPTRPSCWLLEGLLFYLPPEVIERVVDQISSLAAPGSRLGFDIVNAATLTNPMTRPWIEMQAKQGAPWLGTMNDPAALLGARGWQAEVTQPGERDANYGRWRYPAFPRELPNVPRNWFVTARKS